MKISVNWESGLRMTATNEDGLSTVFDAAQEGGAPKSAPSPMEHVLGAIGACSAIDIIGIIKRRRKTVSGLTIKAEADRRDDAPRIFTRIGLHFILVSPDADAAEMSRAVDLSMEKYCSVSAMIKAAGSEVTWTSEVKRP